MVEVDVVVDVDDVVVEDVVVDELDVVVGAVVVDVVEPGIVGTGQFNSWKSSSSWGRSAGRARYSAWSAAQPPATGSRVVDVVLDVGAVMLVEVDVEVEVDVLVVGAVDEVVPVFGTVQPKAWSVARRLCRASGRAM